MLQTLDFSQNSYHRETLYLITQRYKLKTKKFYNINTKVAYKTILSNNFVNIRVNIKDFIDVYVRI